MKTRLIFLLCMILSVLALGQEKQDKKEYADEINGVNVTPPRFLGILNETPAFAKNTKSIEAYMAKNVEYPPDAVRFLTQGTVIAQFTVLSDGKLSDIKMINSVSPEIDAEVIKVLKTTDGMWKPGSNNKVTVPMESEVSVVFKLSGLAKYNDFEYLGRKYYAKGSEMLFTKNAPQKALKYYNKGIKILPKDKSLLLMRGLARYEVGDGEGACQDWNRIKNLGGLEGDPYLNNICEMKGYAELVHILKE